MASGGSTISHGGGLPGRYAAAIYALAEENRALDETIEQMQALGQLIDESEAFRRLLQTPLFDIRQSSQAALAVLQAEGFGDTVRNFVGVVAANRRLAALRSIVEAFAHLVAEKRGIVTAHVVSAHPLSPVQREQLRARLIEAGYGNVDIAEQVDPSLLGGLVVQIGARLYDSSIKSRLHRLQYAMKGAA